MADWRRVYKTLFMNEAIDQALGRQGERLILWAAASFGAGIAVYFSLRAEPPGVLTLAGVVFALILWATLWRFRSAGGGRTLVWLLATASFLAVLGFADAQGRATRLSTVILNKAIGPVEVTGTVSSVDVMEPGEGVRLILSDLTIEDLPPDRTPPKVRIRVRKPGDLRAGQKISVLARLNPPSAPVAPGAFDFQRYAYFQQIGAFGFAYRDPVVVGKDRTYGFSQKITGLRQSIVERIAAAVPFPQAGIVMALIAGEMTAVSEEDWEAMRISGLAHMLSISGLHIGLVAGVFFFTSRALMAAVPYIALRWPIKKYAAVIAFAGALFYTILSGSSVPAVRSMMMTGLILIAVILDRTAFSVRTVALAALAVLIVWPEALWGASFQMSFAAVTALIIFYDEIRGRLSGWYQQAGWVHRGFLYVAGVCVTTLVASLATAPFSLYHFQQIGLYSIPANMAAAPVMSFLIMPAGVLACLLMPFGWEAWPLKAMEWGVSFIMKVAQVTSSWPQASQMIPALPLPVFVLTLLGAMIFLFWRGYGRFVCVLPWIVALIIGFSYQPPDILVSSNMKLVAVRDGQGDLHLSSGRTEKFVAENWLRRNGQSADGGRVWPAEGEVFPGMICAEGGCRWITPDDRRIAFSFLPGTHPEDCGWADILIAQDPVRTDPCDSALVIDRFSVWRDGAHAIWTGGSFDSVGLTRGERPWTVSDQR